MKNLVTIGGGNGQPVMLRALRGLPDVEIKAIVTTLDDGGSTGRLCREFDMLPPGDAMKCLSALSRYELDNFLIKRFSLDGKIKGHSAGNMLLTMLTNYTGTFENGLQALADILAAEGEVIPVSLEKAQLVAHYFSGEKINGQHLIDQPAGYNHDKKIESLTVEPFIKANPRALDAIGQADYIFFGPGDLHTSILANVVVPGVREALGKTQARMVYVANLMSKKGQTQGMGTRELITEIEKYVGRTPDYVLINNAKIKNEIILHYLEDGETPIENNLSDFSGQMILSDFLDSNEVALDENDALLRSILKHDPKKLRPVIQKIIE